MDLDQTMLQDANVDRAKNGYIKVCASWAHRFWLPEANQDTNNYAKLGKPT